MLRSRGAALTVLTAVAIGGAFIALSEDAEATHFWSGSLSWEPAYNDTALAELDLGVVVTGYLGFDTKAFFTDCSSAAVGAQIAGPGSLTVNGQAQTGWRLHVEYVDPNPSGGGTGGHCRFAGRIVGASDPNGVFVNTFQESPGTNMVVRWSLCCREDHDHVNNPHQNAQLETVIAIGQNTRSPIIDFPHVTRITDHGPKGYGNHHCPRNSFCKFYVEAMDPDNDTLTWRLATAAEATGGGSFRHPGAPWTGEFELDQDTGLVTWDTTGASEGDIYSTQIIVEDGVTKVPVDFMVEIGKGCANGNTGVVDPVTGELICEGPPAPVEPPKRCQANPDGDGCRPVPPAPPGGKEYEHAFWPAPKRVLLGQPVASDSHTVEGSVSDDQLDSLAKLDADGDDIDDAVDLCPGSDTTANGDMDGDGIGDGCDDDMDGDGIANGLDGCPDDPEPRCGLTAQGDEIEGGQEAARGFLMPANTVEKEDGSAAIHSEEGSKALGSSWMILVGLAAGVLVLLLLTSRR